MMITGGYNALVGSSVGKSVEVFNPHTNHSCRLRDLPGERRYRQSLCRDLLCGGLDSSTRRSCLKLDPQTGVFTPAAVRLEEERYYHQCGSYQTDGGDEVRLVLNIDKYWIIVMQVLLVTGGINTNDGYLASTEVMKTGGTWRLTAPLPSARNELRAAVVNNNIFVFGENILC